MRRRTAPPLPAAPRLALLLACLVAVTTSGADGLNPADAAARGGEVLNKTFTVFNDGNATLNVTAITKEVNAPWVTVTPPSPFPVMIGAGGSAIFTVTVNTTGVPFPTSERLIVASNDPDENPYPNGIIVNLTPRPPASDVVSFLLGIAGQPPSADANNNGRIEIGDVVRLINLQQ